MSWALGTHGVVQDNPSIQYERINITGDLIAEIDSNEIAVDLANDNIEVEIEVS